MKLAHLTLFLLAVFRLTAAPLVIDDSKIFEGFEEKMDQFKTDAVAATGEDLAEQLKAGAKAKVKLPKVADLGAGANLYAELAPSVFVITSIYKCDKCDKWHRSGGASAWALTADGVMVTNYHVFEGSEDQGAFGIISVTGEVFPVEKVLAASKEADVAIFKVKGSGFRPLGLSIEPAVGTPVNIISHPNGRYFYYTSGRISRYFQNKGRGGADRGVWMHVTAEYAKGSSGGPIFDDQGRVVAMVSSTNSIYYGSKKKDDRGPFQMVVRNCPTAKLIQDLIDPS